jgi:hypothetical protein
MITRSEWQAQNREQLRRLDDCLTVLEEAHEIDLIYVTEAMAELLKTRIPAITPGMRIADAIEEVLRPLPRRWNAGATPVSATTPMTSQRSLALRETEPAGIWID